MTGIVMYIFALLAVAIVATGIGVVLHYRKKVAEERSNR